MVAFGLKTPDMDQRAEPSLFPSRAFNRSIVRVVAVRAMNVAAVIFAPLLA